jgi:hypothetical protein
MFWEHPKNGLSQVLHRDSTWQLYDTQIDVAEKNNLADRSPDVLNALVEHAEKNRSELVYWPSK